MPCCLIEVMAPVLIMPQECVFVGVCLNMLLIVQHNYYKFVSSISLNSCLNFANQFSLLSFFSSLFSLTSVVYVSERYVMGYFD